MSASSNWKLVDRSPANLRDYVMVSDDKTPEETADQLEWLLRADAFHIATPPISPDLVERVAKRISLTGYSITRKQSTDAWNRPGAGSFSFYFDRIPNLEKPNLEVGS